MKGPLATLRPRAVCRPFRVKNWRPQAAAPKEKHDQPINAHADNRLCSSQAPRGETPRYPKTSAQMTRAATTSPMCRRRRPADSGCQVARIPGPGKAPSWTSRRIPDEEMRLTFNSAARNRGKYLKTRKRVQVPSCSHAKSRRLWIRATKLRLCPSLENTW
jgi:hypothetical protein